MRKPKALKLPENFTEEEKVYILNHIKIVQNAIRNYFVKNIVPAKDFAKARGVPLSPEACKFLEDYAIYAFNHYINQSFEETDQVGIRKILEEGFKKN